MSEPIFDPSAIDAAKAHAIECFPNESVGFLMPDGYRPVQNTHPDPQNAFQISDADYLSATDALACVHSHPVADAFEYGAYKPGLYPFCPSDTDMIGQIAANIPWGIIVCNGAFSADPFFWGDFVLDRPLLGAVFRHGVEDCFTAIRKWYWQERGVKLPEFPRSSDWWIQDDDLYLKGFPQAGFRRLQDDEEVRPGDVGLTRVGDRRVKSLNHGFVYCGDGLIYHHLYGRLSRREGIGSRRQEQTLWLRYEGAKS